MRLDARLLTLTLTVLTLAVPASAQDTDKTYYVYACAESDDQVALIRHGPRGSELVKNITVGSFPQEIEGPHGINVSPDGQYWFVSLAHGFPYGSVHKYETGTDEWVGDVTLGLFPATLDVAGTTGLMYVVNFNLHGKMEPSSISVVETRTMLEVARIDSGVMPHGSRLNRAGTRQYSVNMMDDNLIEVDALKFEIARTLDLAGSGMDHSAHGGGQMHGDGDMQMKMPTVQPTWVTPPTPQGKVYVAGNKSNAILEVDLASWKITRTFPDTSAGPYNLAATPDGKMLLVTYKKAQSVGFWDLESGREVRRVRTQRAVPHGLAMSPDGEFAFATVEGKGGEPGTVEVYHVATQTRVGVVEMGKQAGGIAFWKIDQ